MEDIQTIHHICTCLIGSLIKGHLFGSMKEDDAYDYYHIRIDDSSAQGGDQNNYSIGEDNSNMYHDIVIDTKLMQL